MKSFFKNIQLKPKKNKDISYDDELVNNLTIKTKPKLKVIISLTLLVFIGSVTATLFFFNYDSNNNKKNTTTKPNINTNAIAKNKQANNNNYIDLALSFTTHLLQLQMSCCQALLRNAQKHSACFQNIFELAVFLLPKSGSCQNLMPSSNVSFETGLDHNFRKNTIRF